MQRYNTTTVIHQEALDYHSRGKPGKLEVKATKPMATQEQLSLAYSPGVAEPVREISKDKAAAYRYTTKGNTVAVVSNGTAILGLGNLGALASKPVMEGKAVLFKRFADVDSIDLEIDTADVDEFVNCVRYIGVAFGGINLEDIAAPNCFVIEERLRELMDIPVFHDDQHGTAIIAAAACINALHLTGREFADTKVVVSGAGSAGVACLNLLKSLGIQKQNALMVDRTGVLHVGRSDGKLSRWQMSHAIETDKRTLAEAMEGADLFLGLSAPNIVTPDMLRSMNDKPIVMAMANPDPEVRPEIVAEVRPDAIIATGRSDYPNQVNNVLGFPYIFRGALDARARTITDEMKIAAAQEIAKLAREDTPDEVAKAYRGQRPSFGPGYIIPAPFDPRLMTRIPVAVAQAAARGGVAREPIENIDAYVEELSARLDPAAAALQGLFRHARLNPKRIIFAEGEEEAVVRAALMLAREGLGKPILVGDTDKVKERLSILGASEDSGVEIVNARFTDTAARYADFLFRRLQRSGYLLRDCQRMVNTDRNTFAACMLQLNDGDALVTGHTRHFAKALSDIELVIDPMPDGDVFAIHMVIANNRTVLIADTNVTEYPSPEKLANIAENTAQLASRVGIEPRVALVSYGSFGQPSNLVTKRLGQTLNILRGRKVGFEFDGEMNMEVALSEDPREVYPFCRLSGAANVLIMPSYHTANTAIQALKQLGGATTIGPILDGLSKSVQIAPYGATVSDLVNLAAVASYEAHGQRAV